MRLAYADLRGRSFIAASFILLLLSLIASGCSEQAITAQPPVTSSRENTPESPAELQPAATPDLWHTDLTEALAESRRLDRPLLVVSILGDLSSRC